MIAVFLISLYHSVIDLEASMSQAESPKTSISFSSVTAISSSGKLSLNSCSSLLDIDRVFSKVFCYRPSLNGLIFGLHTWCRIQNRSSNHLAVLPGFLEQRLLGGPCELLNVPGKKACNALISALPKPKPSRFSLNKMDIPGLVVSHFLTKIVYGPFLLSVFVQHTPHTIVL